MLALIIWRTFRITILNQCMNEILVISWCFRQLQFHNCKLKEVVALDVSLIIDSLIHEGVLYYGYTSDKLGVLSITTQELQCLTLPPPPPVGQSKKINSNVQSQHICRHVYWLVRIWQAYQFNLLQFMLILDYSTFWKQSNHFLEEMSK